MTCNECIHKAVCYRVDSVPSDYARKCGDFVGCKALDQEPCTVSVSEKEPNEITEEVTLRFFKNSLKVRWHNFVIYNVEWLKRHWQMEMYIVCGVKPCEDAISRDAVDTLVDELARAISDERCCMSRGRSTATIMQDILDLPSVNPQPKTGQTGHWVNAKVGKLFPSNDFKCSECGNILDFNGVNCGRGDANYCPNCGAKMQEEEE